MQTGSEKEHNTNNWPSYENTTPVPFLPTTPANRVVSVNTMTALTPKKIKAPDTPG